MATAAEEPTVTGIATLRTEPIGDETLAALDIECTGAKGQGICFAIGIAVGRYDELEACQPGGVAPSERIALVMQLMGREERDRLSETYSDEASIWRAVWADRGWEMRCFDEFWVKNLPMLNQLNDSAEYLDQASLATAFNDALTTIERKHRVKHGANNRSSGVGYVVNTIHFDPVFLNSMLGDARQQMMRYWRDGQYGIDTWELRTYIRGLLRVPPHKLSYKLHEKPARDKIIALADKFVEHDHHPANDALHILLCFVKAHSVITSSPELSSMTVAAL